MIGLEKGNQSRNETGTVGDSAKELRNTWDTDQDPQDTGLSGVQVGLEATKESSCSRYTSVRPAWTIDHEPTNGCRLKMERPGRGLRVDVRTVAEMLISRQLKKAKGDCLSVSKRSWCNGQR